MTAYVFTYGTLKEGFPNHHWFKQGMFRKIGTYKTKERFQMRSVDENFPAVLTDAREAPIKGELYEVIKEEQWALLDLLEGYPNMYTKTQVELEGLDGTAIMYVWNMGTKSLKEFNESEHMNNVLEDGFYEWVK